ncbi:MAG: ATP-binding protein [Deltaproteobacteria bacterium]|nr:ATP-binding protein [Deltaproteobacteria bacterium]
MGHTLWQRWLLLALIGLVASLLVAGNLVLSLQWIHKPFAGFFVYENLTVGPYSLPQWTANGTGLRSLDRIATVDGRPLRQRSELYDLVKAAPSGSTFRYQVVRGTETFEFAIASMTLTLRDWLLSFGVYVIMGLAFLIIGAAPYYFRAASPASLPLCFMALAVFVWFETTFDFMTSGFLPRELRIFGLTLTASTGMHLVLLLKTGTPLWRSHPLGLIVIYGISLVLGGAISAAFAGPVETWILAFRAGYVYACVSALAFLVIVLMALRGTLPDLERSRLRVMFFGAALGFFLPSLATVLNSSFQWDIPYNLALIPSVFFPLSVAYALLKYSLFDLGNALKRSLSHVALAALLLVLYVALFSLLDPSSGADEAEPLLPIFFSVLVVVVFNPLLRWIEKIVDRYIYRQEYDPEQVQAEASQFLRSLASAPNVAQGFLQQVAARIGVETTLLTYRPRETHEYLTAATGPNEPNPSAIAGCCELLTDPALPADYHGVSRGEVTTDPRFKPKRDAWLRAFDAMRSELLLPLVFDREIRGFVSLGAKRSRREYSADDLRLLGTLTDQLALSLENGRLYEASVDALGRVEATNKKLLEMDKVKKQFVANVCHELRTPVSTIIGYGEVLLDDSFSGDRRAMLERLVNNGQDLTQLMDNLLNFSRMEADTVFTQFEAVKLKEILQALQMMTQRLIRERPIEFKLNMEPAVETIESDGQKLQQILAELLTNAVKFTERGKIEVSVRTIARDQKSSVEIAIADTGIGIDERHREIIFDDFRQLDGSSTRKYGGTGLGLSLCRKLASALGGQIRVTSEVGMGSVFSLLLPLVPQELKA